MSGGGERGVVPPHALEAIAERVSPEQRRWEEALRADARFREIRSLRVRADAS